MGKVVLIPELRKTKSQDWNYTLIVLWYIIVVLVEVRLLSTALNPQRFPQVLDGQAQTKVTEEEVIQ